MDKIGAQITGRVINRKNVARRGKDGKDYSEQKVTIVPEGRDWPVILQGPETLVLEDQQWYRFTVLIKSIGWADQQTGAFSHGLVTWVLEAEHIPTSVPVSA